MDNGLFDLIYAGIQQGEPKVISGERCFVLSEGSFLKVFGYAFASGRDLTQDARIAAEGYENFEVTFGMVEKNRYYLACKMPGLLDRLWEKKTGTKATTA